MEDEKESGTLSSLPSSSPSSIRGGGIGGGGGATAAEEEAPLFTDDELLEVLRHLDDDDEGYGYDGFDGEHNIGIHVAGGIAVDAYVVGPDDATSRPFREEEDEEGTAAGDSSGEGKGAPPSRQIQPLPDLDWYMESDDPDDPLSWLVDDPDNSKPPQLLLDWGSLRDVGGGEMQVEEGATGLAPDQEDALLMRDWTNSATPTTSSRSGSSRSLRPDMFLGDEGAFGDSPGDPGRFGGRTVANEYGGGDGGGGVLKLLDQLGELKLGESWSGNPADATQSTSTSSTAPAAGAEPRRGEEGRVAFGGEEAAEDANGAPPDGFSQGATDEAALPDYMYCQPCTPLHVQEQQALALQAAAHLQLNSPLLRSPSDAGNGQDPWEQDAIRYDDGDLEDDFASLLNLRDDGGGGEYINEAPPPRRRLKLRPEACRAVQFLLDTFDAKINDDERPDSERLQTLGEEGEEGGAATAEAAAEKPWKADHRAPKRERIGIGHKERILGMDASECGRFVATAGQDGTARVWDARNHRVLATIVHNPLHPNDHECLRVAFAPVSWGFHRLPPSLAMLPPASTASQRQQAGLSREESRYLLATGGADGRVCVWSCLNPSSTASSSWTMQRELDHARLNRFFVPESDSDTPQIYSLQFVPHWRGLPTAPNETQNSFLLTSSDDFVHLWEAVPPPEGDAMSTDGTERIVEIVNDSENADGAGCSAGDLKLREVMSIRFGNMREAGWGVRVCSVTEDGLVVEPDGSGSSDDEGGGSATHGGAAHGTREHWKFGGDRNPHSLVYVFDGRYCASNGLLAVALSDGTLRLVNGRGVCVTLLHLPGLNSHLTSFAFDSAGSRLATTVATGHVILWNLVFGNDAAERKVDDTDNAEGRGETVASDDVLATCQAVLSGHDTGRPVFGAAYCGTNEDIVLSWGVDGRICAWDSKTEGEADGPVSVLLHKPEYPMYAVSLRPDGLAVAGGGSEESFVGIPVYFYDFAPTQGGEGLGADSESDVKTVDVTNV